MAQNESRAGRTWLKVTWGTLVVVLLLLLYVVGRAAVAQLSPWSSVTVKNASGRDVAGIVAYAGGYSHYVGRLANGREVTVVLRVEGDSTAQICRQAADRRALWGGQIYMGRGWDVVFTLAPGDKVKFHADMRVW